MSLCPSADRLDSWASRLRLRRVLGYGSVAVGLCPLSFTLQRSSPSDLLRHHLVGVVNDYGPPDEIMQALTFWT
jgi:hypothetical protein